MERNLCLLRRLAAEANRERYAVVRPAVSRVGRTAASDGGRRLPPRSRAENAICGKKIEDVYSYKYSNKYIYTGPVNSNDDAAAADSGLRCRRSYSPAALAGIEGGPRADGKSSGDSEYPASGEARRLKEG